jgi:hypothetical protein
MCIASFVAAYSAKNVKPNVTNVILIAAMPANSVTTTGAPVGRVVRR